MSGEEINQGSLTEADTCRLLVTPPLYAAGWGQSSTLIGEQRTFTDGRIMVTGGIVRRGKQKRADYILFHRRDFPIAVVEAKEASRPAEDGVQQAREYAEILGLKFAYATNGKRIIEIDYLTGTETEIPSYPSAEALWQRLSGTQGIGEAATKHLLEPFNLVSGKVPRYYQRIAIHRVVEAILLGQKRILVTMATGMQDCCSFSSFAGHRGTVAGTVPANTGDRKFSFWPTATFWSTTRWPRCSHPLAMLVTRLLQAMPARVATCISASIKHCHPMAARCSDSIVPIFSTSSSSTNAIAGPVAPTVHGAEILEYFSPAVQFGMTATPIREEERDTYNYFGNPIYTYSLRQGIEDGFLAPYRVHRVITTVDAAGWRPSKDELDRFGRPIPDDEYQTKDFERTVALRARTQTIAKHLRRC